MRVSTYVSHFGPHLTRLFRHLSTHFCKLRAQVCEACFNARVEVRQARIYLGLVLGELSIYFLACKVSHSPMIGASKRIVNINLDVILGLDSKFGNQIGNEFAWR